MNYSGFFVCLLVCLFRAWEVVIELVVFVSSKGVSVISHIICLVPRHEGLEKWLFRAVSIWHLQLPTFLAYSLRI